MQRFKKSFLWQFAGGFVLGAAGLLALQPAEAESAYPVPAAAATQAGR